MHRLAGMLREQKDAVYALDDPPLRRFAQRLPWLVTGLSLSAFAAWIMASFEQALQANVMIAFFIPSIVYLADAIGTQTETIAVRSLTLERKPLGHLLLKELATGGLLGLTLGALALLGVWVAFADIRLAIGVAASLLIAGTIASSIGLLLPWTLSRFDIDPAFGSGPLGTIIQDVLTILLYFLVMAAMF
jgi:magnesium transporter